MQRRNFMKLAGALAITPAISCAQGAQSQASADSKEIYEWRFYSLEGNGASLDTFFKDVLIPAYNRLQVSVGAFRPFKAEEPGKRYLLLVYPNVTTFHAVKSGIWKDETFRKAAQPFYDATAPSPAYSAFESYLCEAFDKIPQRRLAESGSTLYEIRIYHSPNEEANQRKIRMFNLDEIDVFDKVGINSVCYGDILVGQHMPALIYLTWYKDEATRTEAWKAFGSHPDWQRISKLPEYAYTATRNQSILLAPMAYSQI